MMVGSFLIILSATVGKLIFKVKDYGKKFSQNAAIQQMFLQNQRLRHPLCILMHLIPEHIL